MPRPWSAEMAAEQSANAISHGDEPEHPAIRCHV